MDETFESWWETDGMFIDTDEESVPWRDKRKALCFYAFTAGRKAENEPAVQADCQHIRWFTCKCGMNVCAKCGREYDEKATA